MPRPIDVAQGAIAPERVPLKIFSVRTGSSAFVRFCGNAIWVPTHYLEPKTSPCFGLDHCSLHELALVWKGYAPGLVWSLSKKRWEPWVIELTEWCYECLPSHELRGWLVEMTRTGKNKRGRVDMPWHDEQPEHDLGTVFPVMPTLQRLWHLRQFPHYLQPELLGFASAPQNVPQPPPPCKPQRGSPEVQRLSAEDIQQWRAARAKMAGQQQPPAVQPDNATDEPQRLRVPHIPPVQPPAPSRPKNGKAPRR